MQLAFKASKLAYSTDVTEHSFTCNVFTMNVIKVMQGILILKLMLRY